VPRRAGPVVLGLACFALGAEACTDPSFPDDLHDASVAETDGGDDAPDGGDAPSSRLDAALGGDDGAQRGAEEDASPAPQQDGASPSDAGAAGEAGQATPADAEAGAPAASALPTWAKDLPGTYAKRSVTFSYDESLGTAGGNTRNVEHSIITITENGDELEVSMQLCDFTVELESSSSPPVSFKHVSAVAPVVGHIVLEPPNGFSSEPMLLHLGFEPTRGNSCGASGRRDKFEEQSWITGPSCTCSASALPTGINDCRLTDSDGDGKPAVTARGQYLPLTTMLSDIVLVFDISVTFVEGRVATNGRHDLHEVRAQAASCVNASVDYCNVGNNELCPAGFARLIPLTEGATCAELDRGAFGPPDGFPVDVDCRAGR
jgi:hypothetical protein